MIHLNSPLGLQNKIKPPSLKLENIPILNLLCIVLLLFLLSSKYLFAPGLTIELPEYSEGKLDGRPSTTILSINEANLIFFEGNIYTLENIEKPLMNFIQTSNMQSSTLLAKISKGTEMDTVFKICEIAHKAGFDNIQLAGNFQHFSEKAKPSIKE